MRTPWIIIAALLPLALNAQESASPAFLEFVRAQAAALRAEDAPPASLAEWEHRRTGLRHHIAAALGDFPAAPCSLEPRMLGTLQRDGYRVEKLLLQTLPGVWMTANAYVPDVPGKVPAVLAVHGHWPGAKQDPVVQSRCIGLAKLGFFVLAVDAFGAGERAIGKGLGEYHGEMVAATLFPVGLTLTGVQVYENGRAVDYLLTRPEVDAHRIGITGASGGGNQSMYAGAWDERFGAVVPVCSVGNYQSYLGAACCLCEVLPGALRFTEEGGVLGLIAPRGLLVINATGDARQFSVEEAQKSIASAQPIFDLYGHADHLKHLPFESQHDYNQPMREAMYGWMTRHLKDTGDGAPIPEPAIVTEDPETLRCFPGDSRPDDFLTLPQFAAREARRVLAQRTPPADLDQWAAQARDTFRGLVRSLALNPPLAIGPAVLMEEHVDEHARTLVFQPEPGITLTARQQPLAPPARKMAIVLDLDAGIRAADDALAVSLREAGWSVVTLDLRATGEHAPANDGIGSAPDHNTAEWSLWLGRPLLGQWRMDVRALLDTLEQQGPLPDDVLLAGVGPAGLVALCAAAFDARITQVAAMGMLASYVTEAPYAGQRLGIMVPGILREAGDIPHIAALVAPRPLLIAGGVDGAGAALYTAALDAAFAFTREVYSLLGAAAQFRLLPESEEALLAVPLGVSGR